MLFSLVSLLTLGAVSLAHPVELLERTNGCNADNVLRLLRATQRLDDSLAFCSDYLGLPKVTETATLLPTASVTITEYRTTTETETFLATKTSIDFEKRGADTTTSKSISTPDFILSTSIDPSRLSSACGCLTIPLGTVTVTPTDLPGTTSFSETVTQTVTTIIFKATTTTITAPKLVLASPTSIAKWKVDQPAQFDVDDAYYRLELDFDVEVYGFKSDLLFVSVNGLIWLDEFAKGNYRFYFSDADTNGADLPLGPDDLPDVAILPFWSDLFINGAHVQGIWYQITGTSITFEYLVSAYGSTENDYHFTVTFSAANKVTFHYYSVLDSTKGTVAIQHKSGDEVLLFSRYGSTVAPGLVLDFDTSAGTIDKS